ncbi:hypothetical protein DFH07DRAFT_958130 [Mycena maculata]|uniref:BTB domain-containing protein n=1 Tax=Mycena maculata TaxID=230809 RepID=A0AAD7NG85_9AGAR|nr:hypothetical protein DFH07DRAFT_958130 [Mycena maculata]
MSGATAAESTESPSPAVLTPTFPFANAPGADAILRASDGADFYVHRTILPELGPEIAIISVQEDSALLDRALRFFYPGAQFTVVPLDQLRDFLEVLISKYDVECIVPAAKDRLERYLATNPVAVYAVAFTYQWKDPRSGGG